MEKQLRVLVLTDHENHSAENSLYALVSQMLINDKYAYIDIATRGIPENKAFFYTCKDHQPWATRIRPDFDFGKEEVFTVDKKKVSLSDYDLVFLRLPRPISDHFLLWIEKLAGKITIINKPSGIIETSNKRFLLNFPELCPPIQLCKSIADLLSEAKKHPIVIKPLRAYGGQGIAKIVGNKVDTGGKAMSLDQYVKIIADELSEEGMLAMKYLKNVDQGDKRILVVGGEIMAASLRLPKDGSWLCNVAQGGSSVSTSITDEEKNIVNKLNPTLRKQGIFIYGVDTLVNDEGIRVLSEINTLSIGGFPQAENQSGRPIIKETIEKMYDHVIRSIQ